MADRGQGSGHGREGQNTPYRQGERGSYGTGSPHAGAEETDPRRALPPRVPGEPSYGLPADGDRQQATTGGWTPSGRMEDPGPMDGYTPSGTKPAGPRAGGPYAAIRERRPVERGVPAEARAGQAADGSAGCCLVQILRIPLLIVVLPFRLLWELWLLLWRKALVPVLKAFLRWVLVPVGRAIAWLWRVLVIVPLTFLVHWLVVVPARWLYRWLLTPLGLAGAWLVKYLVVVPLVFLWRYLAVVPARWLHRYVLTPVGHFLAALFHYAVVVPLRALWRYVLGPVVRAVAAALGWSWRIAGIVVRALGRGIARLWRVAVVAPTRALHRWVLAPVGRAIRWVMMPPLRLVGSVLRETGRVLGAVFR